MKTWSQRFLSSGMGTGLFAVAWVRLPFIAANIAIKLFISDPALRDVSNLLKTLVLVAGYWSYVRWHERRPVTELSLAKAGTETMAVSRSVACSSRARWQC